LDLALQKRLDSVRAVYQQDEISGLSAKLKSDVSAFKGKHGWCTPSAGEMFARAAGHGAAAIAGADPASELFHRWDHNHAFGAVEDGFGDIVRDIEYLFQDVSGFFQSILLFFLRKHDCASQ